MVVLKSKLFIQIYATFNFFTIFRYVMSTGQILIQAEVAMDKSWKQNWKPKFVLSTTRLQIKFHFIWLWGSSEKDSPFEMTFECLMMTFWRFFVVCNKNVSFSCKILLLHKPTDLEFHFFIIWNPPISNFKKYIILFFNLRLPSGYSDGGHGVSLADGNNKLSQLILFYSLLCW